MNSFKSSCKNFFLDLKDYYPRMLFWVIILYVFYFLYYQYFLEPVLWIIFSNINSFFIFNLINLVLTYPFILLFSYLIIKFNYILTRSEQKISCFIQSLKLSLIVLMIFLIFIALEEIFYLETIFITIISYIIVFFLLGLFFFYQRNILKKKFLKEFIYSIRFFINQKKLFYFLFFIFISIIFFTIYFISTGFIFFDFISVFIFTFIFFIFIKFSTY